MRITVRLILYNTTAPVRPGTKGKVRMAATPSGPRFVFAGLFETVLGLVGQFVIAEIREDV